MTIKAELLNNGNRTGDLLNVFELKDGEMINKKTLRRGELLNIYDFLNKPIFIACDSLEGEDKFVGHLNILVADKPAVK